MRKIPVGQTIAESYSFVFRKYFPLLGIVWLPLAIMFAVGFLYMRLIYSDGLIAPSQDPAMAMQMAFRHIPFMVAFYLVLLAAMVMVCAGVAREALDIRQGPRFVQFRFGFDELRAFGAIVLLVVMIYGVILVASMIGGIIGIVVVGVHAASAPPQPHANPMAAAAQIIAVIACVLLVIGIVAGYFAIRLGFLLFPVTVTEHKFGLWRSWDLTTGNFWRSFAVIFVTSLPSLVINLVTMAVTVGPTYVAMLSHIGDPHALADQAQQMHMLLQRQLSYLPYLWAGGLILAPFVYGLWIAPAAFAYRSLVAADDSMG
jgi:hypothetical protein